MKAPFEFDYQGYQIAISKSSKDYACCIRGIDLNDLEGGFPSAAEALEAAKSTVDEHIFWLSPEREKEQINAKKLWESLQNRRDRVELIKQRGWA
jgi:hypothetical protein